MHAFNFPDIWENKIFSVIFRVMVTFQLTPTKTYTYMCIYSRSVHSIQYKLFEKFVILLMLCSQSFSKFLCYYDTANVSPLSLPLNQQQCSGKLKGLFTLLEPVWPGYDIKRRVVNNKNPTSALSTRRYLCSNKAIGWYTIYKDRAVNCLLVTSWTIRTHVLINKLLIRQL